ARAVESPADSVANYYVEAKWPNAANPVYSHIIAGFAPGDTIVVVETPDFLLTPAGLEAVGINLSVGLNKVDGIMLIPAVEGTPNTFPTTTTENCSSFAVISPVTDNALITSTYTPDSYNSDEGDNGTYTWGFGISQSVVFDWFDAPVDWADPGSLENFGKLKGFFNEDQSGFDKLEVSWHAVDGQLSDSGVDDDGLRNRFLGISVVPGDTVTVAALNAGYGTSFNVGTYPILGGEGIDGVGVIDTDWGYLFDPKGADGVMMNGDEPLQFTGYYFTFNFLSAVGLFEGLFEYYYGLTTDLKASFIFAADSTLRKFGAPAAFSSAVTTALADSLIIWITAGVPLEDALQAGLLKGIGGTALQAQATDLFFSEYAEGSSNNKYLEIYNGTGSDVDLSNYLIMQNANGGPWNEYVDTLSGILANGDVYVIANASADASILAEADLTGTGICYFNGDDARALIKVSGTDTTILDYIGIFQAADPGNGWDVAGVTDATKDHTLVRKSTIKSGNADWAAAAGTDEASSEWIVLAKDTWTDVGKHTALYSGWTFPDDSDHDYVTGGNGRLVFQVGNSCVPNTQVRDVYAIFENFTVGIESEDILPLKFAVHENYPNPFNPITKISFDLPEFSPTKVTVWNMLGQKVATLYSGDLPSGRHTITFDARNDNGIVLPSGLYFYRVESGHFVATKKMMLLK
ncbi:MAG: lamin tail domain-containing protein, partial [Candidatus Marinimicrobia bacterium]|nr:lamin tail domain-containing protein [Candidatus Neomarinimicrobiota bacterium]